MSISDMTDDSFPGMQTCGKLRVLTYNVWFDPKDYTTRAALLLKIIRELNPDVVALQEVTERFLQILRNDPMVVNECTPADEETLSNSIIQRVEIKKLSHRQAPYPSPKRQIWTWDCDGDLIERTPSVVRSIFQSESATSATVSQCEAKYTLISEPDLGRVEKYGTALLTRQLPSAMIHQVYEGGDMGRSIMGVEIPVGCGGQTSWVATTHLESSEGTGGKDNHTVRKEQIAEALSTLQRSAYSSPVIFMGDMNPTRAEEEGWFSPPWVDAWLMLRPDDPGFTSDFISNPYVAPPLCCCAFAARCPGLKSAMPLPGEPLAQRKGSLSSSGSSSSSSSPGASSCMFLNPKEITIVGRPCQAQCQDSGPDPDMMCTPEPASRPEIVPSDHFGVCCEFDLEMRLFAEDQQMASP